MNILTMNLKVTLKNKDVFYVTGYAYEDSTYVFRMADDTNKKYHIDEVLWIDPHNEPVTPKQPLTPKPKVKRAKRRKKGMPYDYSIARWTKDGRLSTLTSRVWAEDEDDADRKIDKRWAHKAYDISRQF